MCIFGNKESRLHRLRVKNRALIRENNRLHKQLEEANSEINSDRSLLKTIFKNVNGLRVLSDKYPGFKYRYQIGEAGVEDDFIPNMDLSMPLDWWITRILENLKNFIYRHI